MKKKEKKNDTRHRARAINAIEAHNSFFTSLGFLSCYFKYNFLYWLCLPRPLKLGWQ